MRDATPSGTFQNPVFDRSFPDPYVLKFRGEYFSFATGYAGDGLCFPRLRSRDLVRWEELPGAMPPLETGEPYYWAPEVNYVNGKFYLYYSAGNETFMTIRVAVSDTPDGEFKDTGRKLTIQDFAIDPHVFQDTDGRFFMFYATDFLDYSHIGTGTVVDEMIDPFTLRGEPRPVTRAQFDWQVYDLARKEKGGARWHTVEGPFVLKRKNIYYEMFSGGNWKNISYGVSFAVTGDIESDNEWSQYSDGVKTAPILKTLPGKVIGPGHNSVVEGPNNRELYCIYHRWEADQRVMAIDRMDFAGDGHLFVVGPSFEPQVVPYKPHIFDDFTDLDLSRWDIRKGEGRVANNELISNGKTAEIAMITQQPSFLCKVHVRLTEVSDSSGGLSFFLANGERTAIALRSKSGRQFVQWKSSDSFQEYELRPDLDLTAFHELTFEVDHHWVKYTLDRHEFAVKQKLPSSVAEIGLSSDNQAAAFSAFTVTDGFEELFEENDLDIRGWSTNGKEGFTFKEDRLCVTADEHVTSQLTKELPCENFELAVNVDFAKHGPDTSLTIMCANTFVVTLSPQWQIETGDASFLLPENVSTDGWHQFRFVAIESEIAMWLDNVFVGTGRKMHSEGLSISIRNAEIHFDMVRFTQI